MASAGFVYDVQVAHLDGLAVARVSLAFTRQNTQDRLHRVWQALEDDVLPQCAETDYAYFDFADVGASLRELCAVLAFGIDHPSSDQAGVFCVAPFAPDVLMRTVDAQSPLLARHVLLDRTRQDPCFRHLTDLAVQLVSSGSLTDRGDFAKTHTAGAAAAHSASPPLQAQFASLALLCAAGQHFLGRTGKRRLENARATVCEAVASAIAAQVPRNLPRLPLCVFVRRPPVDDGDLHKYSSAHN